MILIYKNPTPNIKALHNLQLQIFPSHNFERLWNSDRVLQSNWHMSESHKSDFLQVG